MDKCDMQNMILKQPELIPHSMILSWLFSRLITFDSILQRINLSKLRSEMRLLSYPCDWTKRIQVEWLSCFIKMYAIPRRTCCLKSGLNFRSNKDKNMKLRKQFKVWRLLLSWAGTMGRMASADVKCNVFIMWELN